jgi:hypothetical protein
MGGQMQQQLQHHMPGPGQGPGRQGAMLAAAGRSGTNIQMSPPHASAAQSPPYLGATGVCVSTSDIMFRDAAPAVASMKALCRPRSFRCAPRARPAGCEVLAVLTCKKISTIGGADMVCYMHVVCGSRTQI